jgi:hypothetical protein
MRLRPRCLPLLLGVGADIRALPLSPKEISIHIRIGLFQNRPKTKGWVLVASCVITQYVDQPQHAIGTTQLR